MSKIILHSTEDIKCDKLSASWAGSIGFVVVLSLFVVISGLLIGLFDFWSRHITSHFIQRMKCPVGPFGNPSMVRPFFPPCCTPYTFHTPSPLNFLEAETL